MQDTTTISHDEFFESLLGDFLDESGQLLDRLNRNMLQLDEWLRGLDDAAPRSCDAVLLNEMFRSAHSLKGLSAMLGLSDINHLTHKIENVFDAARKNELDLDCDVVDLMFQALDRLVGLVDVLKDPGRETIDCGDVLDGIHRILESAGVEKKLASQSDAEQTLNQLIVEAESATAAAARGELAEPKAPSAETCPLGAGIDHFADLVDESDLQSKYVSIFIDETELSLDSLTDVLLALERHGHGAAIEQLLITSHRIKGSAASIGLNRAAKLAHLMEDSMQEISGSGRSLTPKITDALLACIDGLRKYVESLKAGCPHTAHFNPLARQLMDAQTSDISANAILTPDCVSMPTAVASTTTASAQPAASQVDEALRRRVLEKITEVERESTLFGVVCFQPDLPLVGLKGRLLYEKLSNIGIIRYFSPAVEQLEELEELASLEFGVVTEKSSEMVERLLRIAGVTNIDIEPLAGRMEAEKADLLAVLQSPGSPAAADSSTVNLHVSQAAVPKIDSPMKEFVPEAAVENADANTKAEKGRAADTGGKPTETLRVDIERLDQLMNLAGQLVINKARFAQIGDKLKKAVSGGQSRYALNNITSLLAKMTESGENGLRNDGENVRSHSRRIQQDLEEIRRDVESLATVRAAVNELFETIHQLDRVTNGIQQGVMDTRMLPIGPLFQRFKRVIRDIARANGNDIRLEIEGEKTELDKRMIDELGDPLIHLVRNSADHGIESPAIRIAAGKPAQGTVALDAFHRGNSIYLRVTDDGKGLDSERIKAKALEKGLISPVEAEGMTKAQIFQLIWKPGLTTAEKVTEVSGRGMGMDIVKSKIEDLNGTIELDSEAGRGTTVTIKLPLTLAILPSLMVSIDGDTFALPLESVVEIVSVSPQDVCSVSNRATARVRDRVVSMVQLGEVFAWNERKRDRDIRAKTLENAQSTLVIVGENGREIGLAVDRVIGEQDIVIKSMAENYRNVPGVAGASILGDGRVSLILDLAAVIDMATCRKAEV